MKNRNNIAYIDGANLHKGIKSQGWILDYKRFRVWLSDKFSIKKAYIFIGLIPQNIDLYNELQTAGFELIFKETVHLKDGNLKGNCDADLVLKTVCDFYENEFDKCVIVSSDGDYSCLVRFLLEKNKFLSLLSPADKNKCSILLKRTGASIVYLKSVKNKIETAQNEKAPDKDGTL